ncbi:MAG: sigma-54-dependent Fis family transcriptional regulator [Ignavibacteriae bacterium]|nr:sigma-54-dependent Fis family transcriptional regulator [Ignavibacteriota bacterium]
MPETILLVDDDVKMKSIVAEVLQHEGFTILTAMNGKDALQILENNNVDLTLLDIKLPDIDGIELLKEFIRGKPSIPVIMISGFGTIDRAVAATKLGAYDFLEKPLEPQRVFVTIKNALEKSRLEKSQKALVEDMMIRYGVIGVSEALRKLCAAASRIARLDTPVLITGENGTGKELLANVIHQLSGRKTLVCMNCAAVPHELIESELFGHKKGTFTGAVADKLGKFQAADHGTLFLDEIGDMSLEMQAKILRALETKEVCMVGGNEITKVDVRFIAATNKNLQEEIQKGRFREDLFYRLRGVTLHIPPLRERQEDIQPLAKHFLDKFCQDRQMPKKRLPDETIKLLQEQEWRGNVRELKYVVENLAIFADDDSIDHLQVLTLLHSLSQTSKPETFNLLASTSTLKDITSLYEKNLILNALKETHGNISHAAEKLNIDRATLSKKIKRYGLKP